MKTPEMEQTARGNGRPVEETSTPQGAAMQTIPDTQTLLQIAEARPCPEWCEHAVCEPLDDVDGVGRLHTLYFWRSDDGDRCIEWSRHDIHTVDGVVTGPGEMHVDLPDYRDDPQAWKDGLSRSYYFVHALDRESHSE